jgi:hypothetical protein
VDEKFEPDALEERVLMFASIRAGLERQKLTPMTRLAQDAGIKGDDASKFFDAYAQEFRVNLDELNMHWDSHFRPEAGLVLNTVFWVVGILLLAFFLTGPIFMWYWASSNEWWIWSGLVAVLSLFTAWFRQQKTTPVTIADLIDAARAGRWVKSYLPNR